MAFSSVLLPRNRLETAVYSKDLAIAQRSNGQLDLKRESIFSVTAIHVKSLEEDHTR